MCVSHQTVSSYEIKLSLFDFFLMVLTSICSVCISLRISVSMSYKVFCFSSKRCSKRLKLRSSISIICWLPSLMTDWQSSS